MHLKKIILTSVLFNRIEYVPTHNKHIFVRPKKGVLNMGKSAYLGKSAFFGKWRILHLRYRLYRIDSSIRIGLFVYNRE